MVDSITIDAIVKKYQEMFPSFTITFGYIGNVWPGTDDRSWSIGARPSDIKQAWDYPDIYYLKTNTRSKKWNEETMFDFDEEHFLAWLQKQKERYNG